MQEVIIIALIACWIGEWSKLIQNIAWWFKSKWIDYVFGCAKCWGFWLGLYYGWDKEYYLVWAIIISATAQIFNKIYMRL